jgi:hypothetical protein
VRSNLCGVFLDLPGIRLGCGPYGCCGVGCGLWLCVCKVVLSGRVEGGTCCMRGGRGVVPSRSRWRTARWGVWKTMRLIMHECVSRQRIFVWNLCLECSEKHHSKRTPHLDDKNEKSGDGRKRYVVNLKKLNVQKEPSGIWRKGYVVNSDKFNVQKEHDRKNTRERTHTWIPK